MQLMAETSCVVLMISSLEIQTPLGGGLKLEAEEQIFASHR
jgi:hypothetical protein